MPAELWLVFSWATYEAGGGWSDLDGRFATAEAAIAHLNQVIGYHDRAQVVNPDTGVVRCFERDCSVIEECSQVAWIEVAE